MKDSLVISEKFYSIQGEGQTTGYPSIFIRLAGCNLLCQSDSWVCDSIEVWKKGIETKFKEVLNASEVTRLKEGAHLILTGGEPLLHQAKINRYLEWFISRYNFKPFIEVETNGTIMPDFGMDMHVDQWNCSPKLPNSGEPYVKRVKDIVIRHLNTHPSTIFKFVIHKGIDIIDLLLEYGDFISREKIVLMPAGEDQEKLKETRKEVIEQCLNLGFRYSDRLHIVIWNQKTGV